MQADPKHDPPSNLLEYNAEVLLKATPAQVWDALVNPAIVASYHMAPLRRIELRTGGTIEYGSSEAASIIGKITELQAGRLLQHTFRFTELLDGASDDPESWVRYELLPAGEETCLRLLHGGFTSENQTYANIRDGWPYILKGLVALWREGE